MCGRFLEDGKRPLTGAPTSQGSASSSPITAHKKRDRHKPVSFFMVRIVITDFPKALSRKIGLTANGTLPRPKKVSTGHFLPRFAGVGLSSPITAHKKRDRHKPVFYRMRIDWPSANGTLPRPKKVSTGHFLPPLRWGRPLRVPSQPIKKETGLCLSLFFYGTDRDNGFRNT